VAGLPRVAELDRFGFGPLNTRRFTRPMFKVPDEDRAFSVWLFRSPPVGDQAALSAMMASNRELLAKMTAVGGKRYSPYSGVMSSEEWAAHFGPALTAAAPLGELPASRAAGRHARLIFVKPMIQCRKGRPSWSASPFLRRYPRGSCSAAPFIRLAPFCSLVSASSSSAPSSALS